MESQKTSRFIIGWVFFILWAILIVSGIVAKRVYGHPDMVIAFHLPAAVCLVLAWRELSWKVRKEYQASLERLRKQLTDSNGVA